MLTIGFLVNKLTLRGTEIALYDYADFNEKLLNNKSIVITRDYDVVKHEYDVDIKAYEKFKSRFDNIIYYRSPSDLDTIVETNKIDVLYIIKGGDKNDGLVTTKCKTIIHCVFNSTDPHGDYYCAISRNVNTNNNTNIPIFHHMVRVHDTDEHMRTELNIPSDAIVFGNYGGRDSFDIEYIKHAVNIVANNHMNIYFIFMNTEPFGQPNTKLIFLEGSSCLEKKRKFINTCDAMIYGRSLGETFGLACGEFSVCNKPIIANANPPHRFHIDTLGDAILLHNNLNELLNILVSFNKETKKINTTGYHNYTPIHVMNEFQQILDYLKCTN